MELLGHCEIALRCGRHDPDEVFGTGLLDLMLPNLMHCHDWAYASMWHIEYYPEDMQAAARLVRTHMVTDWVIHYGVNQTHCKRKCGWAYRRMAIVRAEQDRFFADAHSAGLLAPHAVPPSQWSKKQRLDFLHSIVEYALDLRFADAWPARHFERLKATLSRLGGPDRRQGRRHVHARCAALAAHSDHDAAFLERSLDAFAHDAAQAQRPDDFAVATVIRKYGLVDTPAARHYVRRFLQRIAAAMDSTDVQAMVDEIVAAAAAPMAIYSGGCPASPTHKIAHA